MCSSSSALLTTQFQKQFLVDDEILERSVAVASKRIKWEGIVVPYKVRFHMLREEVCCAMLKSQTSPKMA